MFIILPVHRKYARKYGIPAWDSNDKDDAEREKRKKLAPHGYLWIYVVFTYVFSGLAILMLQRQTIKIIRIRQKYLGERTSTTDRTIRLSGIPPEMRSEDKLKEFLESLEVGKVENVTLCRNWSELDSFMDERLKILKELEAAWTKHLGYSKRTGDGDSLVLTQQGPNGSPVQDEEDAEQALLLPEGAREPVDDEAHARPKLRLWHGWPVKLHYRMVDAIDYYEEKLRRLDERILAAREKEYPPAEIAFVTMESIAASQTLVQTIISPQPMRLFARLAPPPADVVWKNTYLPRSRRMMQAWFITAIIVFLTIFWSAILFAIASVLELKTLRKVFPQFADLLTRHPLAKPLIRTGLPTLVLSLLTVAVPYVYSCKPPPLLCPL